MEKFIVGIDLGSRFVKIIIFEDGNIVRKYQYDTVNFYKNYCKIKNNSLIVDFNKLDIPSDNICSTGYGRNNIRVNNSIAINELKAHVWGIFHQLNLENFTLLDIGGQDVKIIKVKNGYIDDFAMNDKCAASTGRFIENVIKILDIDFNTFFNKIDKPEIISSTCAIFGESEIIGKIAEGKHIDNICAGVNYTLAQRISSMMSNLLLQPLVVSGGVSKNKALLYFLKKITLTSDILLPDDPIFNGAIGCCNYFLKVKKSP